MGTKDELTGEPGRDFHILSYSITMYTPTDGVHVLPGFGVFSDAGGDDKELHALLRFHANPLNVRAPSAVAGRYWEVDYPIEAMPGVIAALQGKEPRLQIEPSDGPARLAKVISKTQGVG